MNIFEEMREQIKKSTMEAEIRLVEAKASFDNSIKENRKELDKLLETIGMENNTQDFTEDFKEMNEILDELF